MGKAPAYQHYAAEYLADERVQLLSLEEEGIYIRLKSYCWREGSIPAESSKLSRLCKGCSLDSLTAVLELFDVDEGTGRLVSGELEEQRTKHAEFKASCAARGSEGAKKRWQKHSSAIAEPIAEPIANDSFASASSSSIASATASKDQVPLALTAIAVPAPAPFITLPLNSRVMFPITPEQVSEWSTLYPAVDVEQELRNYRGHFGADSKSERPRRASSRA